MRIPRPAVLFAVLAACLLVQSPAAAQTDEFGLEIPEKGNRERYVPGPEFKVGVGVLPAPSIAEIMSDVVVAAITLGSVESETESNDLALFAEYVHPLRDRASLVAHLGYCSYDKVYSLRSGGDLVGTTTHRYFSLMLGTKAYYVQAAHFAIYGDAMLGLGLAHASSDTDDLTADSEQGLAFQITPLGVRIGRERAVDLSAGFGYKGVFMASANFVF